jgi:hypothetical protein
MRAVVRRSSILLVFSLILATFALPVLADEVVLHEGAFSPADLAWESRGDGSVRPVMDGLRHLALPGASDLPAAELVLLVPMDRVVTDLVVTPLATHALAAPAPLAEALAAEAHDGTPVQLAAPVDKAAPAWGRMTGSHVWRGYRLVTVTVHPVRGGVGTEAAEFLDAYAVRATLAPAPADEDVVERRRLVAGEAERTSRILAGVVANPRELAGYTRSEGIAVAAEDKGFVPTPLPSLTGSAVPYVIITNEALAPEFQRLADHKTARGLATMVVTREYIAANYRNGADIQETIRMFIRDAYELWGAEYVLLGGDSDILPPRYINNSLYPAGGSTDIPCDLYFQCLDGNWNANGNSIYGEPLTAVTDDLADFAEEVYIGRAPVSDPAQAAVFIDKIISYETVSPTAGWPNRILYAAEVLFPDDWAPGDVIQLDGADYPEAQVNNSIVPCSDMEYVRMYQTFDRNAGDAILTKAALTDSLNSGHFGIVNQIGHGYFYTMSVGDLAFNNPDADALVNGDNLFMLYALNCASAAFDYSCLMERFIQNPAGGSVSSIGAVRAAFPSTSNNYQQEFFRQLVCEGEQHQGALVALSRLPWLGQTNVNYTDRWTYENYTLLGDPTMELWTSRPTDVEVAVPSGVGLGPQVIPVTVTAGGNPLAGVQVCLSKDGEDWAQGVTDAAGMVSLPALPVTLGAYSVVVSGSNAEHAAASIPVTSSGGYLAVSAVEIIDDGTLGSQGNGNGLADAGETVAIMVTMTETGGGFLPAFSAAVASSEPGFSLTSASASYAGVPAGGSVVSTTPYLAVIDPELADGSPVTLTFEAVVGGSTFESVHDLRVLAPELEVVVIDWEDSTFGNGDGLLWNGERQGVTFVAKNFGGGRADAVTARLRTSDANVVLYDTLTTVGDLESLDDASGAARFSLALSSVLPRSLARIELTDSHGRVTSRSFYLQRPSAPTLIDLDASLGPDVLALSWDMSASTDVVGYHVYRSESPGGPFVRANRDLVEGVAYFRDEGLDFLTTYYYRVAAVDSVMVPSAMTDVFSRSTAPPEAAAFPLTFKEETSSHLAVGDVDGDGDNEIVLASDEIYVWHHDGTELMDGDGNSQTLGPMTNLGSDFGPAGVVLANLDGRPGLEIVASEHGTTDAIHVFNHLGEELPGWPQSLATVTGTRWNWATPAVGDIDGDNEPEIVVNTLNGRVWVWNVDGTEVRDGDGNPASNGVFYEREGAIYEWTMSGPALEDLDGDGAKDIIFGTKNDATGTRRLMALRLDGTDVPGFPVVTNGVILCHPAVGDLDGDGVQEIVVFTGNRWVYVVRQDGSAYPGFPVQPPGLFAASSWATSPALGDLDGDGELEIVIAGNETGSASDLWAIDTGIGDGSSGTVMAGWPQALPGSAECSPVVGDITGDGSPDIVHGIGGGASTAPNNLYAFHADGSLIDGFPMTLGGPCMPSATICDLERDGDVDIVYGGWDRLLHVWDLPSAFDPQVLPWSTFHANNARTGVHLPLALVGVGDDASVPSAFAVTAPYPNPFNPQTSVKMYVPASGNLRLIVHDVRGRVVRTLHDGHIAAGWHVQTWDGRDDGGRAQASGLYFMRAESAGETAVHKMTLVK